MAVFNPPTTGPELNIRAELCNEGEAIYFLMSQEMAKEMGFIHCEVEEEKDE